MSNTFNNHLNNLAKANGIEASGNGRYRYIYTSDDLAKSFYESRQDLTYPLLKESARQRYLIANTEGLEKAIMRLCEKAIEEASKEMAEMVSADIVNTVTYQLNNLVQTANGTIVSKGGSIKSSKTKESIFAKALAKGLVKGLSDIIDELTDPR